MKTGACFAYLTLALAVGVVSLAVAEAQKDESHQFADRDGVWTVKIEDQGMSFIRLSPAQRQAVVQKRDAIFEVVRSTKVLNPLKGVDIVAVKSVEARADAEGRWPTTTPVVMQIDLTFGSFFKDVKTGRVLHAMIEAPRLYVVTNDLETLSAPWKVNRFWYEALRGE